MNTTNLTVDTSGIVSTNLSNLSNTVTTASARQFRTQDLLISGETITIGSLTMKVDDFKICMEQLLIDMKRDHPEHFI